MRNLVVAVLAILGLAGCHRHVVVVHESAPPPPPPAARTTVHVSYGWTHHRYAVWTEYYYCNDEEVYYLENCGYDDDDILVCLYMARRARVPLRHVFYEYDRCGRSFYTTSMCFRLPWNIWFCHEVPHYYSGCPPLYARCYGYYWGNEPHYYSNDEIHALVHFQVGVRYYGYSHATYFREYDACAQRRDPTPFRTIVVRDHTMAAKGGRNCDEKTVVIRSGRPFEAKPQEWDKVHQARSQEIKVKVAPQERDEQDKARRAGEERREAHEAAKQHVEEAKAQRQVADRKRDEDERVKGPKPAGPGSAARPLPVEPAKKVDEGRPGRSDEARPAVGGPDKTPGPPPGKGPQPRGEPGPKAEPGPGRGPEPKRNEPGPKVNEPGPPGKSEEPPRKGPPPRKQEEPGPGKKGDEGGGQKAPPPPPPRKQDEPGPGKKGDEGGPRKGPPPPSEKKQDDSDKKGGDKKK